MKSIFFSILQIAILTFVIPGFAADGVSTAESTKPTTLVGWTASYKEGGGGIWIASPDDNIKIGFQGYAQTVQKLYSGDNYNFPSVTDYPVGFSVRRARFDFSTVVMNRYTLFAEFDGAPTTNTTAGKESGAGLVEAHTTFKLVGDQLVARFGKYVIPFSGENFRSSRAYDTVERSMVDNAMFGLPALDTQYGAMLMGKFFETNTLAYYLSVTNGNAKASSNYAESNAGKDTTVRLNYDLINSKEDRQQLTLGVAFDNDQEDIQTLTLKDLAGAAYNATAVSGVRNGWSGDIYYVNGPFSLRTEYSDIHWKDAPNSPSLSGGFFQLAYFVSGSEAEGGFQPLIRAEYAKIAGGLTTADSDHLTALMIGWQWFLHANVRHQLNLVQTTPGGAAAAGTPYNDNKAHYALLSEFQIKF